MIYVSTWEYAKNINKSYIPGPIAAVPQMQKASSATRLSARPSHPQAERRRNDWFFWDKIPWWKQLEDNPRYIALLTRIEAMLAEQRALLKQMDESEASSQSIN